MKKFLAVCVFLALSGAAMASSVSTSFKGTVDVKFDWVNFSDTFTEDNPTNCNDWDNFAVKFDAYMVLCYQEVLCPICPFNIEDAYIWLVDKKSGKVFYSELDNGISAASGYCFGDGVVGVMITTYLPYIALIDSDGAAYGFTSPEVTFVLTGNREKVDYKNFAPQNILKLDGGVSFFDINPTERPTSLTADGLVCDDGSQALFATVSFKKENVKVKKDPYCVGCGIPCGEIVAVTLEKVLKAAKPRGVKGGKYFWFSVDGEDSLTLINDLLID